MTASITGEFKADEHVRKNGLQLLWGWQAPSGGKYPKLAAQCIPLKFEATRLARSGFKNAARQYEQEAHDRTEVAVAEAIAQTHADMLHELFRIEQNVVGCRVARGPNCPSSWRSAQGF